MPKISDGCRHLAENVICGVLRLGGGVDHELSIVPKLLQPTGDVCRLILDYGRRDSRLGAEVRRSHLGHQLFDAVRRRSKRRGLKDRFATEPLLMACAVDQFVKPARVILFGGDEEFRRRQGDPISSAAL